MAFGKFLDLLFPAVCLGCRTGVPEGVVLCEVCVKSVRLNQTLFCGRCGARIPRLRQGFGGQVGRQAGRTAINRICHKDFPYVLGAAAQYDSTTVKNVVRALKFRCAKLAAEPLAAFLVKYAMILALPLEEYTVVPIPLSLARLRQRGFNQSELIAQIFAERFSLRLETRSLTRTKDTKPQSETRRLAERKENIRNCFTVKDPGALHGKNIILVDDVTTSGATLFEAAGVLKSAGAKKILALAVARA